MSVSEEEKEEKEEEEEECTMMISKWKVMEMFPTATAQRKRL